MTSHYCVSVMQTAYGGQEVIFYTVSTITSCQNTESSCHLRFAWIYQTERPQEAYVLIFNLYLPLVISSKLAQYRLSSSSSILLFTSWPSSGFCASSEPHDCKQPIVKWNSWYLELYLLTHCKLAQMFLWTSTLKLAELHFCYQGFICLWTCFVFINLSHEKCETVGTFDNKVMWW